METDVEAFVGVFVCDILHVVIEIAVQLCN
jgi:hypothetical protein